MSALSAGGTRNENHEGVREGAGEGGDDQGNSH
jgi:hypothetical protein